MASHLLLLVASQGHWVISQKRSSLGSGAQSQVSPGDGASFDARAVSRTFSQGKWPRGLPRNRAWGSCRSLARLRGGVGFPGLPYKVPHGGLDIRSGGWKCELRCGQGGSLRGGEEESAPCLSGSWRPLQSLPSLACSRIAASLFHFCMACSLCACLCHMSPFIRKQSCWIRAI